MLAGYTDSTGCEREIVMHDGWRGSVLVVDRDRGTREDYRLVAHLAADEPSENAALICRHYLDACPEARCCRPLLDEDLQIHPLAVYGGEDYDSATLTAQPVPRDSAGGRYALELVAGRASIPELRWRRRASSQAQVVARTVSLREVVASLELYEPVCSITESTLTLHRANRQVSISVLEAELLRVRESPIVLNRGLREAVLARISKRGLSMSEIALRCGRVKRDRNGNESGETSWLARRVGLLAEGGQGAPAPWIHSDVLALIARRGLGISPREVEVA